MAPLSVLYCQLAPGSMPVTFTLPRLVMPSLGLAPLSVARARVGADGAALSTVMAAGLLLVVPVLPATSVCLTTMARRRAQVPAARVRLLPAPGLKVAPLSVLYCQLAPGSMPVTFTRCQGW
ncbi:MAG: hypothetical protein IPL73_25345 [Candidatus Obscuribacter sp.]|nr:hypothetical protein [Candidatus Obscuribacter sp.]